MVKVKLRKKNPAIDVAFNIDQPVTAIIGKSGAGKSTILNMIAGITDVDEGYVQGTIDYLKRPIHERNFGYVQQDSLLFPHLTVLENLTYSGQQLHLDEYIEVFELGHLLAAYPRQLSGGEAQRVALVRTLMSQPALMLLDEAFSAMNAQLRQKIRRYLKAQQSTPILLVSHDLQEVQEMADHVIVIENGKIVEEGTVDAIFLHFKKRQTAQLLGVANIFANHAIRAGMIVLAKEGIPAKAAYHFYSDYVLAHLQLEKETLVAQLSWGNYEAFGGKRDVHIKILKVNKLEG